jgi:hypothetical protein
MANRGENAKKIKKHCELGALRGSLLQSQKLLRVLEKAMGWKPTNWIYSSLQMNF